MAAEVDLWAAAQDLIRVVDTPDGGTARERNSAAVLSAVGTAASAMPAAVAAFQSAARQGAGLSVVFPPAVMQGLRDGTFRLLQTADGSMTATAVNSAGSFVANGRVVEGAGKSVVAGGTLGTSAVIALPIAIAAIASYQQQQQLERALKDIQSSLDRIEERLKDEEHGVCDAAESFIAIANSALQSGALPPYLRSELAVHRVRVEGVYAARRRYVHRFKAELERQQVAYEAKKGERQPWVEQVQDMAKEGVLEEELVLFVRTLIAQSRLDAFAAMCLAEEGAPDLAAQVLHESQIELRSEFFDLHNRLVPLANIAPPRGLRDRVPGLSRQVERAHKVTKSLVGQLNQHVLPSIPDPHNEKAVVVDLSADDVRVLAPLLSVA